MLCSRVPCANSRSIYGISAAAAVFAEVKAGGFAEDQRIDGDEPPRLLIGSAAHHHAIDMLQMRKCRFDAADAAVEDHRKPRMRAL